MTPKEKMFALEYLKDLDAGAAAKRAGYKQPKSQGPRTRVRPEVNAYITEQMERRGARTLITADRVLYEIERLAMFDPSELIHVNKPEDIKDLPEPVRRAIVGWSWDKSGNFILKLAKEKALEMLGRHHKLFVDRIEIKDTTNYVDILEKARQRTKANSPKEVVVLDDDQKRIEIK